jgi:hypothetical protein
MADQAPTSALYYPHWGVSDPRFLFEALMFWDRLAVIGPDERFRPLTSHADAALSREIAALNERYVSVVVPSDDEKRQAHDRLKAVLEQKVPAWCTVGSLVPEQVATLATEKFLPDTIELLRSGGWAKAGRADDRDINVLSEAVANVCMNALVDACARDSLPPVTANAADFAASCNLLLGELEARGQLDLHTGGPADQDAQPQLGDDLLVRTKSRFHTIEGAITPERLRKLLDLRDDPEIDDLRVRYRETVFGRLQAVRTAPETEIGLRLDELDDQLEKDRAQLERVLKRARIDWVISRDGIIATIAAAGFGVAAFLSGGAALAVVPAVVAASLSGAIGLREHQRARRAAFETHWTSWLFQLERA